MHVNDFLCFLFFSRNSSSNLLRSSMPRSQSIWHNMHLNFSYNTSPMQFSSMVMIFPKSYLIMCIKWFDLYFLTLFDENKKWRCVNKNIFLLKMKWALALCTLCNKGKAPTTVKPFNTPKVIDNSPKICSPRSDKTQLYWATKRIHICELPVALVQLSSVSAMRMGLQSYLAPCRL